MYQVVYGEPLIEPFSSQCQRRTKEYIESYQIYHAVHKVRHKYIPLIVSIYTRPIKTYRYADYGLGI